MQQKKKHNRKLPDSDNLELKRTNNQAMSNEHRQTNKHRATMKKNKQELDHIFNGITCAITVNLYIFHIGEQHGKT